MTCAFATQDVFMAHVRSLLNADAMMAGVDCSAIRISTTAPITSLVSMEPHAGTLDKDLTLVVVLLDTLALIVRPESAMNVLISLVLMEVLVKEMEKMITCVFVLWVLLASIVK